MKNQCLFIMKRIEAVGKQEYWSCTIHAFEAVSLPDGMAVTGYPDGHSGQNFVNKGRKHLRLPPAPSKSRPSKCHEQNMKYRDACPESRFRELNVVTVMWHKPTMADVEVQAEESSAN